MSVEWNRCHLLLSLLKFMNVYFSWTGSVRIIVTKRSPNVRNTCKTLTSIPQRKLFNVRRTIDVRSVDKGSDVIHLLSYTSGICR